MSPLWRREFYGVSFILENLGNPVLNSVTQYRVLLGSTNHFCTIYCTLFMWTSGSTNVTVRIPLSSAGSITVVMIQAAHWHFIATYKAPRLVTNFNWPPHCTPSKARCITIHTVTPCFFYTALILYHFRPCPLCCLIRFSDQNFVRLSLIFPACYMSHLLYDPYLVALLTQLNLISN